MGQFSKAGRARRLFFCECSRGDGERPAGPSLGFGKVFFRKSGKSGPAVGLCHSSRWPAWGIRHDGECPISTLFTGESAMMFRSANILSKWPISVPIRPSWRKVGPTFLGPRNRFVRHPFPLVQHLKMIVQHGKKYVQHGRPICPSSQKNCPSSRNLWSIIDRRFRHRMGRS
ncbi:hypothetical protein Cdeb_03318 [Caldibacillus debilis GB1]|jgi:hypothetical protein|uniref:Uncharacterized protein n=1 Tax=Caldibacillus debilis GB1 TaxID=1339248 RepID=A0A420VFS2_9BACI|nr:hypothetical protein Cdeb_03318 [Caldibacillus debilis GB1]